MKFNPVRYSSAVGESWHHFSSKTKYCHPIFNIKEVREECYRLLIRGILGEFPSVKQKYFYGSGLWNPAYYLESVGKDKNFIKNYIRKQRYCSGLQTKLNDFF